MVKRISKEDLEAGLTFDSVGRMDFHPDYHPNNGKPYTAEEYEYICKFSDFDGLRSVSYALGRTEKSIAVRLQMIKRDGKVGYYKRLEKYYVSRR